MKPDEKGFYHFDCGCMISSLQQVRCPLHNAASDLLKACKDMLEWARRVKVTNPGMEVSNACNAIVKAEGRKP